MWGLALHHDGQAMAQVEALPPSVSAESLPVPYTTFPATGGPVLVDPNAVVEAPDYGPSGWTWQALPEGLIYRSYLAGGREPRLGVQIIREKDKHYLWDVALGGRAGLLRYGTCDPLWPEGWQLDIEGAAFPRLDMDDHRDLVSTDFRFGLPLTFRRGKGEFKLAYYHFSSHLGDEFLLSHPGYPRRNYVRDAMVLGFGLRPGENLRFYAEADWAFSEDDGAQPWEFQFGAEYSPGQPSQWYGAPFAAINSRLRQEVDYSGNLTVQAGWQWRGESGHLFRLGLHYFNGLADQGQFFDEHEEQIGFGVWYDF